MESAADSKHSLGQLIPRDTFKCPQLNKKPSSRRIDHDSVFNLGPQFHYLHGIIVCNTEFAMAGFFEAQRTVSDICTM